MNGLTKKELNDLKNILLQCREDYPELHKDNDCTDLLTKIQSMINNYCDHTWTDGSGNLILCTKCQAYGGKK